MKKLILGTVIVLFLVSTIYGETFTISKKDLQDKIKGGWAGQVIGCTYGGPTEFRYKSAIIQDYVPIKWYDGYLKETYGRRPGLYDDVYMDLTFVDIFEKKGIDAPVEEFAKAFAYAQYPLWHANQQARYNILNGIMPPLSGHWTNNPHADDIDFQIEADFAGLMSPGMVNTSAEISDKIGHIMNYGDGWYGGVYVGAMYSLSFVSSDIEYIVTQALKVIPEETSYYKCMSDVIKWYKENPNDWKETWFKVQKKWGQDIGCPGGVFDAYNTDAKINSAWVLLGPLYGEGDFGKTIEISTRCGDDSDCNPSTSGGILGTILGYKNIPEYWKQGLAEVEPIDFKYTTISLNDAYELSYKHALELIRRNGGRIGEKQITIKLQKHKQVKTEIGFEGHWPVELRRLGMSLKDNYSFEFEGIGFSTYGVPRSKGKDYTFLVDVVIDGKLSRTMKLPSNSHDRSPSPFWQYNLPDGKHKVELKVKNKADKAYIEIRTLVIYGPKAKVAVGKTKFRTLAVSEYVDKMKAGWIGQMAGVGQGAPTEYRWKGAIIPEDKMPKWKPETINQFRQDDLYVEMTFLRTLEMHGLDVTARQAGIDFANTSYGIANANYMGRSNLRCGIAPPDSGHPKFNKYADDIDYQIEADFSGLIAPGMPNLAIELGEKFGSLVNYGDGIYGGQFIAGMYTEAFFEKDVEKIIRAGLRCIPEQSQYAECIRDVLRWYGENPNDWEKTWFLINEKYQKNPLYRRFSSRGSEADFNTDAKINGAFVVMGLLYGKGDIDKTIVISTRCGLDSDCNPSSAAGVLCTTIGFSKLPEQYKSALDQNQEFRANNQNRMVTSSGYNFSKLIDVCEKLARQAVIKAGGRIEEGFFDREDIFVIHLKEPKPSKFVQSWQPEPISNSKFTWQEMKNAKLYEEFRKFAPGWWISQCPNSTRDDIHVLGLHKEKAGRKNVFVAPLGREIDCIISQNFYVPKDKKPILKLTVGHVQADGEHPDGDWELIVKVSKDVALTKIISKETCEDGWVDIDIDLLKVVDRRGVYRINLISKANKHNGWNVAYWHKIELVIE